MNYKKYLSIASHHLNTDAISNINTDLVEKTSTMRAYLYRNYYRDAYELFEYCEILLKIIHGHANTNAAYEYANRPVNAAAIAEENSRIQEYIRQDIYRKIKAARASQATEEEQNHTHTFSSNEPIDVSSKFFNTEILNYKSEYNMQISESDPMRAIHLICQAHTDIQLSALFLLKCIDVYTCKLLNKSQYPGAAKLLPFFSEYKIPDAEMVYEKPDEDNPETIRFNLLPAGTTSVIINKIRSTLKLDAIINHLTMILIAPEKNAELLQNLFDQTEDILFAHNVRYKEFYIEGMAAQSNGNIMEPLDIPDAIAKSHIKALYQANPISLFVDPTKINQRISYLKSHIVFDNFFNVEFVVKEILSLKKLSQKEAQDKETLIYANILLSAAYLLRYFNHITHGDIAKICNYNLPAIFKLWEEEPHLVDQKAVILLNIPALENQIEMLKSGSTFSMLSKLRDYNRGADSICRFTEILLRQAKGLTRPRELEDFVF